MSPQLDGSGVVLPTWVVPHTAYVARCSGCNATPDQDGGEYRASPWEAARVVNEVEGWRLDDGALFCPDCAAITCPHCGGYSPLEVPRCPRCNGDEFISRGEAASYDGGER